MENIMTTKDSQKIHESDSNIFLSHMLMGACRNNEIPQEHRTALIDDGLKQFQIFADGSVMPTGMYSSVDHCVSSRKAKGFKEISSTKLTKKESLLKKLAEYSSAGNMAAFKKCRKQYSEEVVFNNISILIW